MHASLNIMPGPAAVLGAVCLIATASGQATLPGIAVRAVAEVETKAIEEGREVVHISPANRVVPGDEVFYTLEIRNSSASDVAPTVTWPIPEHMAYIADSATGPGADVTYSADGGTTFTVADGLTAMGVDPKYYTHIRWKFRNRLKSKSVAFARFRAVVK